jgi:predicted DNA-binding protein
MSKLTAFRLPEDLLEEIEELSSKLKADRTAIVIKALQIGIDKIKGSKLRIERPLLPEDVEQMINESNKVLISEIEELKKQIKNLSK